MAAQKAPERITGTSKVLRRNRMSDTSTGNGKVVVNRSMSLDGYIAGPGHAMDWIFDFVAPDEFPEIAAATGAMLIWRRTYEVANRMDADRERGSAPSDETYPFSGPVFVLTHRPPEPPDPEVTFLTGDIGEAVATARSAAGGKNLEILGADVAAPSAERCRGGDPGSRDVPLSGALRVSGGSRPDIQIPAEKTPAADVSHTTP
jgi:dihydrofolate reductase